MEREGGAGFGVTQGLLDGVNIGDIAEDKDRSDHLALAVADRGTTVGDIVFEAIFGEEYGVIGQALDGSFAERFGDGNGGRLPGFFADDAEDFSDVTALGGSEGPTGELFRERVQQCDPRSIIRGDNRIADGIEGHGKLFLAGLERDVKLQELLSGGLLVGEQVFRLEMNDAGQFVFCFPENEIAEGKRPNDGDKEGRQNEIEKGAKVHLKAGFIGRALPMFDEEEGV